MLHVVVLPLEDDAVRQLDIVAPADPELDVDAGLHLLREQGLAAAQPYFDAVGASVGAFVAFLTDLGASAMAASEWSSSLAETIATLATEVIAYFTGVQEGSAAFWNIQAAIQAGVQVVLNYAQVWADLATTIASAAAALMNGDIAGAWAALSAGFGQVVTDYQTYALSLAQLLLDTATTIATNVATWGQAFVDWIAPYVGPALAALSAWVAQLWAWVVAQAPVWVAQLMAWGQAFVAWVAPMIPPAIAALGGLLGGNGANILPELPVKAWHEVSKSLGDMVPRDMAGNIIEPAKAAPIESLRKSMVDTLRQNVPAFDIAQTNSAAMRSSQEALDLGRKLARIATGDTGDAVLDAATKSATNLPYAQAGYSQGLRDVISGVPYGGNPASRLANPKVLERTAELVGNDKANSLYSKLLAEKLRMDFANRGINNSATAETAFQAINSVSDIPLSAAEVAKKGGNKLLNILNSGTDRRAASMLYATSPEEKAVLASLLMKSSTPTGFRGMKVLSEAERRAMAGLLTQTAPALPAQIGGALYNSGGQ